MAQWWEHSPPTAVSRVWLPDPAWYVGWVCCWFSSLLRVFFPGFSTFPPSTNTNTPNSNLICAFDHHVMLKCVLQVLSIILFIYLFNNQGLVASTVLVLKEPACPSDPWLNLLNSYQVLDILLLTKRPFFFSAAVSVEIISGKSKANCHIPIFILFWPTCSLICRANQKMIPS